MRRRRIPALGTRQAWRSSAVLCALALLATHVSAAPARPPKGVERPSAQEPPRSGETEADDSDPARREARELARKAIDLMAAERWAEAQPLLDRAYRLVPAPTIALLEGEALEHLGRWVAAAERYRVARDTQLGDDSPVAFRSAVKKAAKSLTQLESKIPRLVIAIRGAPPSGTLQVVVDGAPVDPKAFDTPQPIDPGEHVVVASLDGREVVREKVTLASAETRQVVLGLVGRTTAKTGPEAPPPPPPRPRAAHGAQYTMGWVALGLGAAGTAFGLVTGAMMLDAQGNLDAVCKPTCPAGARNDLSRFRTTRTLSSVGYVTGAAGLALGAVLLLTDSGASTESRVGVYGEGSVVGVKGAF
jgi:hypothetical protein